MNTISYSEPWTSPIRPPVAVGQLYRFPLTPLREEQFCLVMVVGLSEIEFGVVYMSNGRRRMVGSRLEEVTADLLENEAVLVKTPVTVTPLP